MMHLEMRASVHSLQRSLRDGTAFTKLLLQQLVIVRRHRELLALLVAYALEVS